MKKYIRDNSHCATSADGLNVALSNGDSFTGSLQAFRAWAQDHLNDAWIKSADLRGYRVGLFPAFIPTNQRQRDYLAGWASQPIDAQLVTFASRNAAKQLYNQMRKVNIPVDPRRNLTWVIVDGETA